MGITEPIEYKPATTSEAIARALIVKTFLEAKHRKGSLTAAVAGAREFTDRVEGPVSTGAPDVNINLFDVAVRFGPRGAETELIRHDDENSE